MGRGVAGGESSNQTTNQPKSYVLVIAQYIEKKATILSTFSQSEAS